MSNENSALVSGVEDVRESETSSPDLFSTTHKGSVNLWTKLSLVPVFGVWIALKYCRGDLQDVAEAKTPFRVAMWVIGVYFGVIYLVTDFGGRILKDVVPLAKDNTNWAWSWLISTNFTMSLALMMMLMGSSDYVARQAIEPLMFMFLYNMRNTWINFFGVGAPVDGLNWLSFADGALIWPSAGCVFYQYFEFQEK